MDDWITTSEAAEISGFHIEYIRRIIRNGIIYGKKWGREWMVDRNSLLEYLELNRRPGPKVKNNGESNT